jgi:predicted  nucleic acid-binding Zn-ribbon protein
MDSEAIVTCSNCGEHLPKSSSLRPELREPCPNCGSTQWAFAKNLSGTVEFKSKRRMKARRQGFKKPFIEQVTGDDLHRNTGRWMKLTRVIDRLRDWYHEKVTDPETGRTVHECEEPLSKHQGHGGAKRPKSE